MKNKLDSISLNIITGGLLGILIVFLIKLTRIDDLIWIFCLLMGSIIGWLRVKERRVFENLKEERELLEDELNKIQGTTKKATNKYRLLVENASDAIYLTMENGKILFFNQALCLLTGYSKEQLKNMTLSKIQVKDTEDDDQKKIWLDNGICRFEECWRNKAGEIVFLEINSKWIEVTENKLILYVARDIKRRKEADNDRRVKDIHFFQKDKLNSHAIMNQVLYKRIFNPLTNTIKLINYLMGKYPSEEANVNKVFKEWKESQTFFKELLFKNSRDLKVAPLQWDINEIISQEINYLEIATESQGFVNKKNFGSGIPKITGIGTDFSLAFGTLLKAFLLSMGSDFNKGLDLSTQFIDDYIVIEFQAKTVNAFNNYLSQTVDPSCRDNESELGLKAMQLMFENFGAKLGFVQQTDKGMNLQIKLPVSNKKEGKKENFKLSNN
jgi:PAS domain S-box-containing protein